MHVYLVIYKDNVKTVLFEVIQFSIRIIKYIQKKNSHLNTLSLSLSLYIYIYIIYFACPERERNILKWVVFESDS